MWLSGLVEFEQAEEILREIGGITMSDSSAWRRTQKWGKKIKAQQAKRSAAARAMPERGVVVRGEQPTGERLGVAMDGTMVHICEEGYKELKTGGVFRVVRQQNEDGTEGARSVQESYVGVLGGPDRLGMDLWGEACRRHWSGAQDTIVVGDGAPWIWKLALEHFGSSRQAVDWYHAKQHLYQAGYLAFGEGSLEAVRWAEGKTTPLYQGLARQLAETISELAAGRKGDAAEALRTEAGYFERNERRMQYMELREDGWPIGSGMVESGCKQFGARLGGPGMRWSRTGAEHMIAIRAAIMSHRFDEVWAATYAA